MESPTKKNTPLLTDLEIKLINCVSRGEIFRFSKEDLKGLSDETFIRASLIKAIVSGSLFTVDSLEAEGNSDLPPSQSKTESRQDSARKLLCEFQHNPKRVHICPEINFGSKKDILSDRYTFPRLNIEGELDLRYMTRPDGGSLPALALEYCLFKEPIDLSEASLTCFSIQGSGFPAFLARGAAFAGSVNLDWCGPVEFFSETGLDSSKQRELYPFSDELVETVFADEKHADDTEEKVERKKVRCLTEGDKLAACILDLRRANIAGSLTMSYANFCLIRNASIPSLDNHPVNSAINLRSAHIRDNVTLIQTVVIGGISLASCEIGEDLWISGSRIFSLANDTAERTYESKSLDLQLTCIRGLFVLTEVSSNFDLRSGFHINLIYGRIFGVGLIAKEIWIGHGVFVGGISLPKANVEQSITIGHYSERSVINTCVHGEIGLNNANVGKNVEFHNVEPFARESAFFIPSAVEGEWGKFVEKVLGLRDFGKDKYFYDKYFDITAHGIKVERRFYVSRSTFFCHQYWKEDRYRRTAIDLWKSTLGTGFRIGEHCVVHGGIALNNSRIGREIIIRCKELTAICRPVSTDPKNENADLKGEVPIAIDLSETAVDGHIKIGDQSSSKTSCFRITVRGAISLARAEISGSIGLNKIGLDLTNFPRGRDHENIDERNCINLNSVSCSKELIVKDMRWQSALDAPQNKGDDKIPYSNWSRSNRVSAYPLSFYKDVYLVESRDTKTHTYRRALAELSAEESSGKKQVKLLFELTGLSAPIHELNSQLKKEGRLLLNEEENKKDYLAFFCDSMSGNEGPFKIVNSAFGKEYDVRLIKSDDVSEQDHELAENSLPESDLGKAGKDNKEEQVDDPEKVDIGSDEFDAVIFYSNQLFEARLVVRDDGMVEMKEDTPIHQDEPIEIGLEDKYPNRPYPENVNPNVSTRFYAGSELDRSVTNKLRREIKKVVEPKPQASTKKFFDILDPAKSQADPIAAMAFKYALVVDLVGLRCGSLNDNSGNGWGFNSLDGPQIWLKVAGIACGRIDPKEHRGSDLNSYKDAEAEQESRASDISGAVKPGKDFQESTEGHKKLSQSSSEWSAKTRVEWLGFQFRERSVKRLETRDLRQKSGPDNKKFKVDDDFFIPQSYDHFSDLYFRSGETRSGQEILLTRKNFSNLIEREKIHAFIWPSLFRDKDSKQTPEDFEKIPEKNRKHFPWGIFLVFAIAFCVFFSELDLRYLSVRESLMAILGLSSQSKEVETITYSLGSPYLLLSIVFALFCCAKWIYQVTFRWVFGEGFKYGLSPKRALFIFFVCISLGWLGVDRARTGYWISQPSANSGIGSDSHQINDQRVLVLHSDYDLQPNLGDGKSTEANIDLQVQHLSRIEGYVVHPIPTPCDVGVSSILYTIDLFIPLVDLNQRDRCSIREDLSQDGSDKFYWWRVLTGLYEFAGWIVNGLLILTFSGVLRRDIER